MTLTFLCPQANACDTEITTEPSTATEMQDADAVREAVGQVRDDGWDNPLGRALLDALAAMSRRLTVRVEASARLTHDPSRADDLLSHAWELINSNPEAVIAAENPWAYLTTCLRHTLTNTVIADSLLVSPIAVRNGTAARAGLRPPVRAGDQWVMLEQGANGSTSAGSANGRNWDVGLERLHNLLVHQGAPAVTTSVAIDRISEIIGEVRRGRREAAVATDPELTDSGLKPVQSRALLALLIGARHDQGRSSCWLALRDENHEPAGTPSRVAIERRVRSYVDPFHPTGTSAA